MKAVIIHIVLAFSLVATLAGQPTTGSIAGKVVDSQTGRPLLGANVVVRNTVLGTITDANGEFRLKRVPAGNYDLVVSLVGYQRRLVERVLVVAGEEQKSDVALTPALIETEQIIVTASRREQSLQEVPVSVSTITARTIVERNHITLDDALRYVPGVNMMYDQVNIRGSTGYSRGVGSRVLLLLDGLPYLTGDTGEINWETVPMHQVERIEVVKGAGSALYGSSALGGVINVLTKDIQESPEVHYRLFSGLYDKPRFSEWDWSAKARFTTGAMASISNRLGELGYLFSVSRTVDESFRQNDVYHRWSFYGKLKYDLSASQTLTTTVNYLQRSHGNFFWWKSLREATKPADAQLNGNVDSQRGNISLAYKEFVSDKFFYTVKGMYFGNFWKDDSAGRRNNKSNSHLFNMDVQATYEFSKENVLTFGGGGNYDQVQANLFGTHPGVGAAIYVQDELELLPQLKLTAGLRFDWQRVSALPAAAQLNPKLGVVYQLDNETHLRASYGSGFRYPAIGELYLQATTNVSQVVILPSPDLKAEKSTTYEIGASRSFGEHVFLDAAVFHNSFTNLIEPSVQIKRYKPKPDSPTEVEGPVIQFDNVTKARIDGAEVGVKVEWWKTYLSTDFGYTYTWSRDLTENAVLKFRPRHIFYSAGAWTWERFRLSADFRFVSRIERIDENLVALAPIEDGDQRVPIKVVDVRTSFDLLDLGLPLRIGFNVNNVTNYHYVEFIGNLAPVRTYFLTVDGVL